MLDVAIIGCGVVGAAAAYELSHYPLHTAIFEAENDVADCTTKANSAILHAGYDPEPGTRMARLNVEGVALAKEICARLDVPYRQCGSLVLALSPEELPHLQKLYENGIYLVNGETICSCPEEVAQKSGRATTKEEATKGTMAYGILQAHNQSDDPDALRLKFDSMTSHDITYVGIIQTARASGLKQFPIPYVLTNCHNSLCAVGGTINEDDHRFGLSAAKKYGGIFVPPHMAVIHQYMRERFAGCGKMILGSDSHTRYGALGTMAIGEGGGELAKQLLGRTYDVARPGVVAICLTGALPAGCGPHDVAIALVGELFKSGYVKNKVMEFVGPGIASLRQDTRNAIDAMTTETTCLSSIWETDEKTRQFLTVHGRAGDYKPLHPAELAYYDGVVSVDLSKIRPMIALPMHPSNAFPIEELNANLKDILHECEENVQKLVGRSDVKLDLCSKIENGRLRVDQGVIAGCAGGLFDSIYEAASILKGHTGGCGDYALSVYPGSQPIMMELNRTGVLTDLMAASGRPADALEPKFTCKLCQDTGSVQGRTCTCVHKLMQGLRREEIEALSSLSISSFDTMELRYYPNTMDEKLGEPVRTYMGGLLEDLRSYAEEFDHNSESLMLFGNAGLGKTHAALAIAGIVLQKDFDVIYVSSPDFFGKLENARFDSSEDAETLLRTASAADLLILDDLGTEFVTPYFITTFYSLLNNRLGAGLPTIVTTNIADGSLLEKRYTEKISSRLSSFVPCLFAGEDIRGLKAAE